MPPPEIEPHLDAFGARRTPAKLVHLDPVVLVLVPQGAGWLDWRIEVPVDLLVPIAPLGCCFGWAVRGVKFTEGVHAFIMLDHR